MAANGASAPVDIAVLHTVGMWETTPAVTVALAKGKNVLKFSHSAKGVTIKEFTLVPVKESAQARPALAAPVRGPGLVLFVRSSCHSRGVRMRCRSFLQVVCLGLLLVVAPVATVRGADIPDPDGKPADMTKPVKVFILMGQSNMLGFGKIADAAKEGTLEHAVKTEGLYPFLVDDAGNCTVRKDVRNVLEEPVMILKSCIGNRGLGWDLLPPGSERYEFDVTDKKTGETKTYVFAGYKDSPDKWEKGAESKPIGWYASKQYDDVVANTKKVLEDLKTYYPDAKDFEVAGFFWWQGDKDRYREAHAAQYEKNLVNLIKTLRKDFNAPNDPFVIATLGQTKKGDDGNDGKILDAMLAVDGESGKYPEFKGNVATVYTNPLSKGGRVKRSLQRQRPDLHERRFGHG